MADQDASWLIGSATPSFSMSFSTTSQIGVVAPGAVGVNLVALARPPAPRV